MISLSRFTPHSAGHCISLGLIDIMKTPRPFFLFIAALSPAVLLVSSCAKNDGASSTIQTATNDAGKTVQATKAATKDDINGVKAATTDSGNGMKDYIYGNRAELSTDLNRMAAKLDNKVHEIEMAPKLAGIPDATSRARDGAIKEFNGARADLEAGLASLDNATAGTWADAQGNIVQAWKRMQAAYEKVASFGTATNPAAGI
jgi:hypothetical protein